MRKHGSSKLILASFLVLTMSLWMFACKTPEEKEGEGKTGTADKRERTDAVSTDTDRKDSGTASSRAERPAEPTKGSPQEADKELSPEEYWNVQAKLQETVIEFLKKRLEAYKDLSDKPDELKEKLKEISTEQMRAMNDIWKQRGIKPAQRFPHGDNAKQIKRERQTYLKDNPQVFEQLKDLSQEKNEIMSEIREYRGEPRHRRRAGNKTRELPKVKRAPGSEEGGNPSRP